MKKTVAIVGAACLSMAASAAASTEEVSVPDNLELAASRLVLEERLDRLRSAKGVEAQGGPVLAQWYNWPNWGNGWSNWQNWRNW